MRGKKQKFSGWFLVGGGLVVGLNHHGHEVLLRDVKRRIPAGALQFGSEGEATAELELRVRQGRWPLWTGEARPALRTWS